MLITILSFILRRLNVSADLDNTAAGVWELAAEMRHEGASLREIDRAVIRAIGVRDFAHLRAEHRVGRWLTAERRRQDRSWGGYAWRAPVISPWASYDDIPF